MSKQVATSATGVPLAQVSAVQNGIGLITLNNPPVNSFSPKVAEALDQCLTECLENAQVKAIVITGAGKIFVAGADIPYLLKLTRAGDAQGTIAFLERAHAIVNRIESSPKPVVAALNGDALGGGCELAMACHARICTKNTKLGLPELKLGVLPGMGGTQRLPRLIGLQDAVASILGSKNIPSAKALKSGLVDFVVNKPDELIPAAGKYALDIVAGKIPKKQSSQLIHKVPGKEEIQAVIATARVQTKKKSPNVVHPLLTLDAIEAGLLNGSQAGLKAEIQAFAKCLQNPAAYALLHFFLASKATTKVPGLDLKTAGKIKSVAIIGGGTMGAGIAICFLMKNIPVILKEVNETFLKAGVERILADIQTIVKARRLPPFVVEMMMRGLKPQLTYDGFDKVDVVIEAVIEDIPLKQRIFAELEQKCSPTCIIATNTSTINIEEIIVNCQPSTAKRVLGLHFFSPAHIMPLLEIVRTKYTDPQVLATSVVMAKTINKTPVVVGNCIGFVANRVFFPYGMAGQLLLTGGADPYKIDKALMAFGMPMGIYRMNDSVGVDLGVHIAPIFTKAYPDRVFNTELSQLMVNAKRMGQKNNVGFYKYLQPRKATPDPEGLKPILAQIRTKQSELAIPDTSKLTPQDIIEVCLFPVINECARTLAEGYANSAADIDVVAVMGYGFPAYRGGLMTYGQQVGWANVAKALDKWAKFFPKQAAFFKPSEPLLKLASKQ